MTIRTPLLRRSKEDINAIDWEAVYTEQLPRVYNFFRYRLGDDTLAEDLTAATFERAWRKRSRYRRDLGAFSTWLFSIAKNLAADHFRKAEREVPIEAATQLESPDSLEDTVEQNHDFDRLRGLLTQLPEREQELVALKYGADYTNREIARITGLSETNVGSILHRTVQKLRAQWEIKR